MSHTATRYPRAQQHGNRTTHSSPRTKHILPRGTVRSQVEQPAKQCPFHLCAYHRHSPAEGCTACRPLVCSAHARPLAFMFSSRIIDTTAPNTNFTLDVSVAQVGCVYTLFALS